MLREAAWSLTHNAPPEMEDLWWSNVASLARPRPQDFDPDPKVRRRHPPLPASVRRDPWSVPNILSALKAAGLDARLNLVGDPWWSRAVIVVKMPVKGRAEFALYATPGEGGRMTWEESWAGNYSEPGRRRLRRSVETGLSAIMRRVIREGRHLRPASLEGDPNEEA